MDITQQFNCRDIGRKKIRFKTFFIDSLWYPAAEFFKQVRLPVLPVSGIVPE